MAPRRLQQDSQLYVEAGFWRLRWPEESMERTGSPARHRHRSVWIGPATGPEQLTEEEAESIARENFLSEPDSNPAAPYSTMTVAEFVQNHFLPEHVAAKSAAGRTHYQAILKHVLRPEEVDRMFGANSRNSKLEPVPDWPYLDLTRLCDVHPENVQSLITAALGLGYSTQTVTHIRNVVRSIFAHALRKHFLTGENPASAVTVPEITRHAAQTLTVAQAKEIIRAMRSPEREIALMALLTGMTVSEICGLQWKRVNLAETASRADGEAIPPRNLSVRKQWSLGRLSDVHGKTRNRNLAIPDSLFPVLLELKRRTDYTAPDDFVLVSRSGSPLNSKDIRARRLKEIGQDFQMPWLSWQVFGRTHKTLSLQVEMPFQDLYETPRMTAIDPDVLVRERLKHASQTLLFSPPPL